MGGPMVMYGLETEGFFVRVSNHLDFDPYSHWVGRGAAWSSVPQIRSAILREEKSTAHKEESGESLSSKEVQQ